jgi:predicted AAA+ superfamily ATPase
MVVEDQPAWSASLRSRATLRSSPVRHLADPSLAAAALTATPAKLMRDLATLGLLFESLVIRDLRVYAQAVGGRVYHYRDSNGHEIDAVVELEDGSWGACEVKLGAAAAEEGASSLRAAVAQVNPRVTGEPAFMAVITGNGVAVRREDGIYVVPIGSLRP